MILMLFRRLIITELHAVRNLALPTNRFLLYPAEYLLTQPLQIIFVGIPREFGAYRTGL